MKKLIFILFFLIFSFVLLNIFLKYDISYKESIKIYDRNDVLLYDVRGDKGRNHSYENINQVPNFIKKIVLTREDKDFYSHFGVDFSSIVRALYINIKNNKRSQGASTIDQQVVKLHMQAYNRTYTQKLKEIFLAINLNFHYKKEDILLYYINNLPFGNGIRGFKSACNIYYNKSCSGLNKGQLIYLFTISKYGSFGDYSDKSLSFAKSIGLQDYEKQDFYGFYKNAGFYVDKKAPFFVEYYKQFIKDNKTVFKTNFDYEIYSHIETILSNLKTYLTSLDVNDACVLLMDKDQNIISMNLLREYGDSYVNGCLRKQQVGSSMKPFLYLKGMQTLSYTKETILKDEEVEYILENGGKYKPKNFNLKYHGNVPLEKALGSSLNIPAVNILKDMGIDSYKNFLMDLAHIVGTKEKFDDDFNTYGLSIALGTKPISPLDFTKMRTIFLLKEAKTLKQKQFLEKYDIETIKDILSKNENRLLSFNQNNWIDVEDTFVKTGTSRHFKDGRTCGGYSSYILCVRTGNYNAMPMQKSSINTAGIIWNNVINYLQKVY